MSSGTDIKVCLLTGFIYRLFVPSYSVVRAVTKHAVDAVEVQMRKLRAPTQQNNVHPTR